MNNFTLDVPFIVSNPLYGGSGYFAGESPGLVTVNGRPARRQIFVMDRLSMKIVGGTWSDEDGTWRISHLNQNRKYLIIALDHKQEYEPVAWDWVSPVVDTNG